MPEYECAAEALEIIISRTVDQWPDGMLLGVRAIVELEFGIRVMRRHQPAGQDD